MPPCVRRPVASTVVTLVLSVHSRDTLWLLVDRRLSYGGRRRPIDDAVKVMDLETTDGRGLLGYAGLGATSRGTQPSEWMSAVLRGHGGLTFEQALGILSDAANRQLPRHLASFPDPRQRTHAIIVPAFVRDVGARLDSIDNVIRPDTGQHHYRYTRWVGPAKGSPSVRIGHAGTGGNYLAREVTPWKRALLTLVKAHDRGKVSDYLVADQLARLNYEVHRAVRDGTVGPRCIVVWRRRPGMRPPITGGGIQYYTDTDRDGASGGIPCIANGMDLGAIVELSWQDFQRRIPDHFLHGASLESDKDEMNRLMAKLPSDPDEKLR